VLFRDIGEMTRTCFDSITFMYFSAADLSLVCISRKGVCWGISSQAYRRETLLNHESQQS